MVHRRIGIGHRLRLDALKRIDQQHRPFAAGERPRDFVVKIDVPRRIDQVQLVLLSARSVYFIDTGWALIVMPRARSSAMSSSNCSFISRLADRAGEFQQPIGQRALAVVDVGDDREIADELGIGHGGEDADSGGGIQEPLNWRRRPRRIISSWRGPTNTTLAQFPNPSNYSVSAPVARRSAMRRASVKIGDVEFLVHRMDVSLAAAERHRRNAVGREPIGVEPAVRDRQLRLAPFRTARPPSPRRRSARRAAVETLRSRADPRS